jgi:hypothetical protein
MSKARELAELGAVYDSGALSNRNLIINGAMQISQRTTSDASISDNEFVCDRFSLRTSNAGWYGAEQSTDAPTGFSHSIKFESTGANSPAAGAYIFFTQKIEGFNSAHLEFGTSNAKTITISFHIKSSLTGTFGGSIRNSAQNRSYPFSFTISSANTWEYKTVTIAGDTTGTWVGSTNGIGLDVIFNLGSGTNNQGTAGAWAAAGYLKPTGAVNLVETSGATLFFTGLQLEVGTEATPFEHRSFADELARCQRYYEVIATGDGKEISGGTYYNNSTVHCPLMFETTKRSEAYTLEQVSGTDYYRFYRNNGSDLFNSFTGITRKNTNRTLIYAQSGVSGTSGHGVECLTANASAYIAIDDEL